MSSGDGQADEEPLVVSEEDVPVSSLTGLRLDKTVYAYLHSPNYKDNEKGMHFVRKVLALLVLTYATLLVIVSPFFLIESFQRLIDPYNIFLSIVAFAGVAASIYLAIAKGHETKYAKISLFTLTPCVAVGLGLKFSRYSWSMYVLVALGQATANFAILHAIVQFDTRNLKWLNIWRIILIFLVVSGLWILVMTEAGTRWTVAAAVGLGGWVYAIKIVMNTRKTVLHREPGDFIRATIFILGPPIPDMCIRRQKYQFSKEDDSEVEVEEPQIKENYGGVDGAV
jgi:hypothetical protein